MREVATHSANNEVQITYRNKYTSTRRPSLPNLTLPPAGFPRKVTIESLRAFLATTRAAVKTELTDEQRNTAEFALLYAASSVATLHSKSRDALRARAVLEQSLYDLSLPIYKAFALARLARHALLLDAPDLGERWMTTIAVDFKVIELSSEVAIAKALLARARGDAEFGLRWLGQGSLDEFVGVGRVWAAVLRADALEKLGRQREADALTAC
jgi:hypothetical protein